MQKHEAREKSLAGSRPENYDTGKGMVKFTWLFRTVVTGTLSCCLCYFVLRNDTS